MQWVKGENSWHSDHVEIDVHTCWRMVRENYAGNETGPFMLALLELPAGQTVTGLEAALAEPAFSALAPHIEIPSWWRTVNTDTGIALDKGGFITARVTPGFIGMIVAAGADASVLLRSLSISRNPDRSLNANLGPAGARGIPGPLPVDAVIMGIIDDALPLAHPRFRSLSAGGILATRWSAAWLQQAKGSAPAASKRYGLILNDLEIRNAVNLAHGDEIAAMLLFGQIGTSSENGHCLMKRASHGFHVADLLAGADPLSSAAETRPLIGVQLPSITSQDASGLSLAANVVDALVFILTEARVLLAATDGRRPIVVNMSYGLFMGAHDGSSPLERALSHIVNAVRSAFPDAPLILTLPAGNTLQSRGHACVTFDATGHAKSITWRVLPDSGATALLEVWWPSGSSGGSVTLTAPSGSSETVSATQPMAWLNTVAGETVAQAVYVEPSTATGQTRPMVALAIAPTHAMPDAVNSAVAPHGRWQVEITGKDGEQAHLWIARGDTPFGFSRRGRQSAFEDAAYIVTDAVGRPSMEDDAAAVIKRGGSLNGLATALSPDIVAAGAWDEQRGGASPYSGAGYPINTLAGAVRAPDVVATADQGRALSGVLAAGVMGGSHVALNGTSIASPQLARAIADSLASVARPGFATPVATGRELAGLLVPTARRNPGGAPSSLLGEGPIGFAADPWLAKLAGLRKG
jgi:hypothetical protein